MPEGADEHPDHVHDGKAGLMGHHHPGHKARPSLGRRFFLKLKERGERRDIKIMAASRPRHFASPAFQLPRTLTPNLILDERRKSTAAHKQKKGEILGAITENHVDEDPENTGSSKVRVMVGMRVEAGSESGEGEGEVEGQGES